MDKSDLMASTVTPFLLRHSDPAISGGRKEVVFIDTGLADWQTLVAGVAAGTEVVLLDGSADGLAQMAAWAAGEDGAGKDGYDAIHVLSHGAEGQVRLGTLILDAAAVQARKDELAVLGGALTDEGDLLLYGCDVASGSGGAFIAALADATGADVAASTDRTGSIAAGGNWTLEAGFGGLEASSMAFEGYAHALDNLSGTAGNDSLTGTAGADTLSGLAGDDTLSGGDGNDSLVGGDGNDLLYGEGGNDTIQGGNGNDTIYGGEGNDTIVGGTGADSIIGGAGNDVIGYSSGSELGVGEFIDTGDGNDIIRFYSTTPGDTLVLPSTLTDSNNTLTVAITGGYSNQVTSTGLKIDASAVTLSGGLTMNGGGGADVLTGTAQNDSLKGGNGDDTFSGGAGNDTLNGEAGDDVFLDPGGDTIVTMESGDIIRLTGGAAKALTASHLQYSSSTKTLTVDFDKDGTFGSAGDVAVVFTNAPTLTGFQVTNNSTFADIKLAAGLNAAPVNSAVPSVSGTSTVGNPLSATTGTWSDPDGDTLSYSYQWYRADDENGTNAASISGATASSYTLITSDAHKYLRVVVTANDGNGGTQTATSAYTAITNSAPVNSAVPSVTGTATVGNALTTTNGTWSDADGDGRSFTYQWYRADDSNGTNAASISGATASSYTLTTSDAHKYLRVVVRANDGKGGTPTATSAYTAITNSAPVNSAVPSVMGTFTVGNALTTTTGTWSDADGDGRSFTYQWYRATDSAGASEVAISGATSSTYTPVAGDLGKYLRVVVTADDSNGGTQTASSTRTVVTTANGVPTNSVGPSVTGTAKVGNPLSTTTGTWSDPDGDTLSYSYQWYRADDENGTNAASISGATASSYTLITSDAHKYLRVVVTANDGNGGTQTATSAYTAITNSAPVNSAVPSVTGTATVGNALTTTNGTWSDADGDGRSFTYQWYRADDSNGTNAASISGATNSSYTLTTSDAHKYLRVVVTANDGRGGTPTATSAYTAIANSAPVNSAVPSVTGTTTVGNALTATNGTWSDADGDGRSFTYQWYRADDSNGTNAASISGATNSSYTLTTSDAHKYLRVVVTANDGRGGTPTATSAYTAITNSAPSLTAPSPISLTDTAAADVFGHQTGMLSSADADGDARTYGITGGTAANFTSNGLTYDRSMAGTYGTLHLDSATGRYVYVPVDSAINALTASASETFTITVSDGALSDSRVLTVAITGTNEAPVMSADTRSLTGIDEDATGNSGDSVASILASAGTATDADGNALGIAITAVDNSNGTWEYKSGAGSWTAITGVSGGSALLLAGTDRVRFVPNANYNGSATGGITFKAWDQTSGTAGTTAGNDTTANGGRGAGGQYSAGSATAGVAVAAVNDAPVLSDSVLVLPGVPQTAGAPSGAVGAAVSSLVAIGTNVADVDGGAVTGIALVGVDTSAGGTWYYSTDGGANWTAVGTVNDSGSALLLRPADRLYYQPAGGSAGLLTGAITFRAWDQTSGTAGTKVATGGGGGSSAFSAATDTASLSVAPVAPDAPDLAAASDTGSSNTDNLTKAGSVTVNGSGAAANATVRLYANGTLRATANADAAGAYSFTDVDASGLDGAVSFTVRQVVAGAESGDSGGLTVTFDRTAPTISIGTVAGDDRISGIEDDSAVAVSGTTSGVEDGQTVTVTIGGVTKTATVNSGAWTVSLTSGEVQGLADGSVALTADVADRAGNAATQATRTIVYDKTAPTISIGTVAGDDRISGIEDDSAVSVSGTTSGVEDGQTVTVTIGGVTKTATVNANAWTVSLSSNEVQAFAEGPLTITAGVSDAAGNAAAPASRTIAYDRTAPATPALTGVFTDDAATTPVTVTNDTTLVVRGTAEAGSRVEVSNGGTLLATATAGADGTWTAALGSAPLADGLYALTATATDAAGNRSAASVVSSVLVDTQAPARPAVSFSATTVDRSTQTNVSFQISGGEAGSTVRWTLSSAGGGAPLTGAGTLNEGGSLTVEGVDVSGLYDGTLLLSLTASDAAGNSAPAATASVAKATAVQVDGVPVQTLTSQAGGRTITTVVVQAPDSGRVEDPATPNAGMADVPVVQETVGGATVTTLQVGLSSGIGVTASGPAERGTPEQTLDGLIRAIQARTAADSSSRTDLVGGGRGFLDALPQTAALLVRTLDFTAAPSSGSAAVRVTGTPQSGGTPTALVLDTTAVGAPLNLHLDHVEFAAVIGDATLVGGEGRQVVFGDAGRQWLYLGAGDDELHGGAGDDTVASAGGNDTLFGDEGNDVVMGGEGDDWVLGGAGDDLIGGGTGNDRGFGGTGNDILFGEEGDDTLTGNEGNDTVVGGTGNDLLFGEDGNDFLVGEDGNDTLHTGAGDDTALGGAGNDLIGLGDGNDLAGGDAGNDTLFGEAGNDTLLGGAGDDLLDGGAGDDLLFADGGADTLRGGAGADVFAFGRSSGGTVVMDFQAGVDRLAFYDATVDLGAVIRSARVEGGNTTLDIGAGNRVTILGQTGDVARWFA